MRPGRRPLWHSPRSPGLEGRGKPPFWRTVPAGRFPPLGDGTLSGLSGGIYELNGPGHITVAYYDPELMSNGTADAGTVPVLCTARYEI